MGAYISLVALVLQVVFLGVVLSFVGVYVHRLLVKNQASRSTLTKNTKQLSHAEAARARARARSVAGHSF